MRPTAVIIIAVFAFATRSPDFRVPAACAKPSHLPNRHIWQIGTSAKPAHPIMPQHARTRQPVLVWFPQFAENNVKQE
jgi:hypothetical protein